MGSVKELQKLLRLKEQRISALEKIILQKDEKINELKSQVDKRDSVMNQINEPRKRGRIGISAEPAVNMNLQKLSSKIFKKFTKKER